MIFDTIREAVNGIENNAARISEFYDKHRSAIRQVAAALVKIDDKVITATATSSSIDLGIAGDRHVLKAVFGAFRRLGYEPSNRPGADPEPHFSCWFDHPDHDCRFWLNFSSSQCTRIKVGTETKEVDIYETICE